MKSLSLPLLLLAFFLLTQGWGSISFGQTPCEEGFAGGFPCHNVDLYALVPISDLGGANILNDIWGWADPESGREFAIVCKSNGTAFVEVTDPSNPIFIGELPTHTINSLWRDAKVYDGFAFIVAESSNHGMQVFDLRRLLTEDTMPATFDEDAHYALFGNAHNIVINEETGYAYAVGSNTFNGGLHIIDIQNPTQPVIAGDFALDGYTHDAQAVIYRGPDTRYCGKEMVFASNENTLTIVDVENKLNTVMLSSVSYETSAYTHQCWLTEDHKYILLNDELDEDQGLTEFTRTYIFDVQDLENPFLIGFHDGTTTAIDHNLYVRWNQVFQSNYRSGLRILDAALVAEGVLSEIGFFDVQPADNNPQFSGTWSNYCYFPSGNVILTDMFTGLFVVRPRTVTANRLLLANLNEASVNGEVYVAYHPEVFDMSFSDLPLGVSAAMNEQSFPGVATYTLDGLDGLLPGAYTFTLTVSHGNDEAVFDVTIDRTAVFSEGIYLQSPEDELVVSNPVNFSWVSFPEDLEYFFELSIDFEFETLVHTALLSETELTLPFSMPEGTYYWRVSAEGACDTHYTSAVGAFEVGITIGFEEVSQETMSVYPNPANHTVTLCMASGKNDHVYICNSLGEMVSGLIRVTSPSIAIDVSGLPPGWYLIRSDSGGTTRFLKR